MNMREIMRLVEATVKNRATQHIDQLPEPLHTKAVAVFNALADGQRWGDPERLGGSSMYNPGIHVSSAYALLTEHVGDLTHRMAEMWDSRHGTYANVRDKVERGLKMIASGIYRQVVRNYEFQSDPERDTETGHRGKQYTGTLKDWINFWHDAGNRYADAHIKLTVWNEAQWHAREAAVASGRCQFADAKRHLQALMAHLGTREEWIAYAGQVTILDDALVPFSG